MDRLKNNSNLKVGDSFKVIGSGVCNSEASRVSGTPGNIYKLRERYVVKYIYDGGLYYANVLNCGTIETECGKFIWNEAKSLQKVEESIHTPIYEVY